MSRNAQYIGAIDQGTSSTRFIVFDRHGACLSSARREHRQICERPGWIEHDALEIWRNTVAVITEALAKADLRAADLAAVGIANQRETTLVWDRRTGAPLHHAIVWQDVRVQDRVTEYAREGGLDRFRASTGLPLSSYFSALKLQWLLDLPAVKARLEASDVLFGTMDSWLLWNLTGGSGAGLHLTDVTNASRTQLMNLATLGWDDELLRAFEIPACVLPQIAPSSCVYGEATIEPLRGVRIASLMGDQQAALFGQACFDHGDTKNTYGTGCFLQMNTGHTPVPSTKGLITTVAYRIGGERPSYALEGSIAVAGALVQWLRDELGLIAASDEVEQLANQVHDNGGVYFVPAFSGLYAPYWNGTARGLIAGLTRFATRSHVARAALEATAYQTRDVIAAMELDSGVSLDELRVDGGMVENSTLMQFQADILNVPVLRPRVTEMTALGAAFAAGLAVGYWQNREELKHGYLLEQEWAPKIQPQARAKLLASWEKAVQRSLNWIE